MNFKDLTQDQVVAMLKAAQDFLDGDFYSAGDIHYQTGMNLQDCQQIADQFSMIRNLKF